MYAILRRSLTPGYPRGHAVQGLYTKERIRVPIRVGVYHSDPETLDGKPEIATLTDEVQ